MRRETRNMNNRTIAFRDDMIKAIAEGRKTQTRRFRKLGNVGAVLLVGNRSMVEF